jgi:hypothetical protein
MSSPETKHFVLQSGDVTIYHNIEHVTAHSYYLGECLNHSLKVWPEST